MTLTGASLANLKRSLDYYVNDNFVSDKSISANFEGVPFDEKPKSEISFAGFDCSLNSGSCALHLFQLFCGKAKDNGFKRTASQHDFKKHFAGFGER